MKASRVSIILVTHNREEYLDKCVESVLSQSFADFEFIIVDNASTDGSRALLEKAKASDSRIKLYFLPFNIQSFARNFALYKATGQYIAIIDSDDKWINHNKLQMQVDFLESHPKHVLVGTDTVEYDKRVGKKNVYRFARRDEDIRQKILGSCQFTHSSVMYNYEKALEAGCYGQFWQIGQDYSLWLRLGQLGKMANLPVQCVERCVATDGKHRLGRKRVSYYSVMLAHQYRKDYPNYNIKRRLRYLYYAILNVI